MTRRTTLAACLGAMGLAATGFTRRAWAAAAGWPEAAFQKKSQADAVQALFGKTAEASDKISIDLPEIAENGAVVPVTVSTTLPGADSIAILVPENPFTLAASYKLAEGTGGSVSCRLKMAKTSDVIALVQSGGKLFSASKQVKVTLGGCGG